MVKIKSLKFRLSILYALVFGCLFIAYGVVLYFSLSSALYRDLDNDLLREAEDLKSNLLQHAELHGKKEIITADYVNLVDTSGRSVNSSRNMDGDILLSFTKYIPKTRQEKAAYVTLKSGDQRLRIICFPFTKGEERYLLQVGSPTALVADILESRFLYIVLSLPIALLAASVIGYFFIKKALDPVIHIARTAKNITHEDLSSRIVLKHVDDEFKMLADSLNDMITRLERSFGYISDFSSHAAHELKTPIAIIRGEAEVALRKGKNLDNYEKVVEISLEESKRILKTIEDLLLLARLDHQSEIFKFEQIDFGEFMKEVYEQSKIMASEKGISINATIPQNPISINADKLHLRRVFFNIIHNAIKFTPSGGRIDIAMTRDESAIKVSIADTGIGIPEKNIPRVFDRFFHVDKAGSDSGNGLGLSIALSLARIHKGDINVSSILNKGTTFTISLPL